MQTINKLFSFIPDKELEAFAIDTQVNKSTKKLHGQLLFKLLFYCLVTEKDNSLRGLQSALESAVFRAVSGIQGDISVSHSSISERLNVVSADFFEKISHTGAGLLTCCHSLLNQRHFNLPFLVYIH